MAGRRSGAIVRANAGFVAIVTVATALRFAMLLWVHAPSDSVYSDMASYHWQAQRILADELSPHDTLRPIGYAAFLAAVYALSHRSLLAVGVIQALLGSLTCALTYPLARRFQLPRGWALLACAVIAFYPPFIFYGTYFLTEAISPLLMTALVVATLWSFERPSWTATAVVGLLFAIGSIVRPNTVPLFPFLCAAAWIAADRRWRAAGIWSARVLVAAIPLLAFIVSLNSQLTGRLVGLSTNGGLNFFLMETDYEGVRYYDGSFSPIRNHNRYRVPFEAEAPFYEEDYYYREGIRAVRADPMRALRRLPDHLREGWGLGQQAYWPSRPRGRDRLPRLDWRILQTCSKSFFVLFVALPTVTLVGMTLSGELWQRVNAGWLLVAGALLTLTLTFLVFLADPRMHVPFDALFVVATLAAVHRRWR
jgi:4-amino-4-deoxy-L-arabinose transferase-like glycosyltransferase